MLFLRLLLGLFFEPGGSVAKWTLDRVQSPTPQHWDKDTPCTAETTKQRALRVMWYWLSNLPGPFSRHWAPTTGHYAAGTETVNHHSHYLLLINRNQIALFSVFGIRKLFSPPCPQPSIAARWGEEVWKPGPGACLARTLWLSTSQAPDIVFLILGRYMYIELQLGYVFIVWSLV